MPQTVASTARRSIARRFSSSAGKFSAKLSATETARHRINVLKTCCLVFIFRSTWARSIKGSSSSVAAWSKASLHLLHKLIDTKARWALTRRVVLKRGEELRHDRLGSDKRPGGIRHKPVIVSVGSDVGALIRIGAQVEHFRHAQLGEWLGPDAHRAIHTLLFKDRFPAFIAHGNEIGVVIEVDELLTRAMVLLTGEIRKLVITIEVHFERLPAYVVAFE